MHLSHARALFMMVLVTLMWSIAGVTTRHLESAHSFEITFWRSAFTVLSLLVILPILQGRAVFTKIARGGVSLWLSGVCWAVMFTAFMLALSMSPVANVLVTMALGPLFTALLARFVIGHRLPMRTWTAIAVAGVGIATMYGAQLSLDGGLDQLLGSLVALPLALPFQATAHDMGLLALLGSVQLAIPCVLSVWCARVLKAPEVSLLQLLEVLFGIALAWLGANEAPDPRVLLGGILVVAALVGNELLGWWQRRV